MNRKMMLSAVAAMSAFAAFAASTVSDVVVRQRWPWSETVDIDYTLTGDKGDVTFSATWDGQATPVVIGTDFQVEAGQHRFEWCPTNNYAGQTLTGFTVTAVAGSTADHKYLILDLVNGGYTFMAAPPAGGWTDEHKSTKMVFARCPAGTYRNGLFHNRSAQTGDITEVFSYEKNYSYLYGQSCNLNDVTFTSDWYIGIYPMTIAQYEQVQNGSATSDYTFKGIAYNNLRGREDGTPSINWPSTKYAVAADSFVKKMRDKAHGNLLIDLPQGGQCEAALRSGTTTFWPTGGTKDDSPEQHTNYVNQIANWYYTNGGVNSLQPVGMKQPNAWGLYDTVGNGASSWCLDTAPRQVTASVDRGYASAGAGGGTDPVGPSYTSPMTTSSGIEYVIKRLVHGGGGYSSTTTLYSLLPCVRNLYGPWYTGIGVRFAIHLKPLNFGD